MRRRHPYGQEARTVARRLHTLGVFFLIFAGAAQAEHKELKPGWNLFSKEQDVQLGREAAQQVEQQMPVVRDAQLNDYVRRIGEKLTASAKADKYPYTFKVVNDPSINAFALPGGPTYVNTGLLKAVENEAQLAGVMAHEIAHVALRHGTNQASKANILQIPAMIAGAAVGGGGLLGQLAQMGVGLGLNGVLLKYSRDAESQADLLGAQLMAQAGYNPLEMARFFEKLQAQGGGSRAPSWFSSHPDPGNRMKKIQEEIQTLPQRQYTNTGSGDLREIQARLGSLPAPNGNRARAAGPVSSGDPRPSGRFTEFRSRAYSIAHPDNWEVFGDNNGVAVTIAPRSGLVQDRSGNVAVAYGVMVSGYTPPSGGRDLRQDTNDLIGQLRQSNPGMQVAGNQQRTRLSGQQALVTTIYNQSPMSGREIDMLVTVDRPEGLLYFVFIAPEQDYRQLQPVFDQMLRSVRF
jgi:Zn-dependent protease with chaperone function